MRTLNKKSLLIGTLLSSAMLSAPAFAQVELGGDDTVNDEIIVTGSRISNANIIASSPVTTIDQEIFERRGVVDAVDVLNDLPAVVAGQTNANSNGATGTATLNLRGLGATRNLVLIDGRRLGPGTPQVIPADLNQIPTPLLERTEIVTGGASAIYGSDAIAGVTNFILRRDFEGVELNALYGINVDSNDNDFAQDILAASSTDGVVPTSTQADGDTFDISAVFGTNFADGRGNVTGFARYVDQQAVTQGTRDISRCAILDLGTNPGPIAGGNASCLGSNFGPFPTTVTLPTIFTTDATGAMVALPGATAGTVSLDASGAIPRDANGDIITGASNAFNFNPTNFFQRPTERFQGGFLANYEATENVEVYLDAMFFRNVTDAQIAPSATFGEIQEVNCDNPFLTAELVDLLCTSRGFGPTDNASVQLNRRFVEGGGRNSLIELDNLRITGGLRGEIAESGWDYDVFGSYSETSQSITNTNDGDIRLLQEALLVTTDANGNPVCTSGRAGCLPLNLFGTGSVDPEALASVLTPTISTGEVTQTILGTTLQGDLNPLVSPLASTPASVLIGGEYRKDTLLNQPDSILIAGGSTGLGGPTTPTDGISEVYEIFGEIGIALIEDLPFIQNLSFTGAYRYSDYDFENGIPGGDQSEGFSTDTYAAGLSWEPIDDIRVRGQYQRAVRAPNVLELFDPTSLGLFDAADPCSGPTPAASLENCVASGLPANLFGFVAEDAGQLQALFGGNTALQPEVSDTFTVGAVVRPQAVPGLTLSVDYFNIEVDDFISPIPPQAVLDGCLTGTPDPAFCALINRDALGGIQVDGFVEAGLQNIAAREVSGFDIAASYNFDLNDLVGDYGDIRLNYAGTIYDTLEQTNFPGADPVDCLGFYGGPCDSVTGSIISDYAHNASVGWASNYGLDLTLTWRYQGPLDSAVAGVDETNFANEFGSENYFDLVGQFEIQDRAEFRIGVNNLLDNDPPIGDFRFTNNGNTFPSTYDSIGRYLFAAVKFKL